jgi:hypothetical protein
MMHFSAIIPTLVVIFVLIPIPPTAAISAVILLILFAGLAISHFLRHSIAPPRS